MDDVNDLGHTYVSKSGKVMPCTSAEKRRLEHMRGVDYSGPVEFKQLPEIKVNSLKIALALLDRPTPNLDDFIEVQKERLAAARRESLIAEQEQKLRTNLIAGLSLAACHKATLDACRTAAREEWKYKHSLWTKIKKWWAS